MNELISVIINVYNGEKYIKKCIDSVINQTYSNLEIIIVNDGSTDNTLKICLSYNDERIKIITQKNTGLSIARNVGIDNSNGEYLYFVDCDDFIEKDVIEYLYKLCKKYNSRLSTCDPLDIYDYNFVVKNEREVITQVSGLDYLKMILLSKKRTGTVWNKLIKKELFNNIRFENRGVNDVVVVYKLVIEAQNIIHSNQIKYYYYRNDESITMRAKNPARTIDFYKASMERYEYIKKCFPNLKENELCMELITINSYLHNNEEVLKFLESYNAIKIYKKLFSFKLLKCDISFKEKIKIVLFRFCPMLFLKTRYKHLANIG